MNEQRDPDADNSRADSVTDTPVLVARGIEKRFGATIALSNGCLEVLPGEVHAIVGENGAGKSTLMNILSGSLAPDAGELWIGGTRALFSSVNDAVAAGIGIVHQELAICPDISVAENMFLGRVPTAVGGIKFRTMDAEAQRYLTMFSATCSPRDRAGDLTIGEQQVIEIARAVSSDCRVVIFDEPTSSLSETESAALFALIADLKSRGIACIYISHRLSEVFDHCDRVTVMRDGGWVRTIRTRDTSPTEVVTAMVGQEIAGLYPDKASQVGEVALEVTGLSSAAGVTDVSFAVRTGEILGLSGLVGSGRSELARAVVSVDKRTEGSMRVFGEAFAPTTFHEAVRAGVCYMTEDRKRDGLFLERSILDNSVAAILDRLGGAGFVSEKRARAAAEEFVGPLNIKLADLAQSISDLSGGNQQKVMIAKWLLAQPRVLILDEPTRGIDVGAKYEIHRLLRALADSGLAIVVISSELPEIVGLSDRVLVMREGEAAGLLVGAEVDESSIVALASGAAA